MPHWDASNEYPQHMFSWRNKKIIRIITKYSSSTTQLHYYAVWSELWWTQDSEGSKMATDRHTTNALIRLCSFASWSDSLLSTHFIKYIFAHCGKITDLEKCLPVFMQYNQAQCLSFIEFSKLTSHYLREPCKLWSDQKCVGWSGSTMFTLIFR